MQFAPLQKEVITGDPSGRWLPSQIVAGARLALAFIFLLAIWADPAQPVRQASLGIACLSAFALWSAVVLFASFNDWWAEFRLAFLALWIDCLAAVAAVYFTEGAQQDFATPLAAFFVFILVSATLLGGWRTALVAGVVVPVGFVAMAYLLTSQGLAVDPIRVGRKFGFFLVIAALVVWYGGRRSLPGAPPLVTVPQPDYPTPLKEALHYASEVFAAGQGLIGWRARSDPHGFLYLAQGCDATGWQLDPAAMRGEPELGTFPLLFKGPAKALALDHEYGIAIRRDVRISAAEGSGCRQGLWIPIKASDGQGFLVLADLRRMGRDLLPLALSVGREVGSAFDRHAASLASHQAGLGRLRQKVARDLHDSVAQSLAGASYRIEAARKAIEAGLDPGAEQAAVGEAMRAEQRHVRTIIERLREGREVRIRYDLADELEQLVAEMATQWGIAASLVRTAQPIEVGPNQLHDLRQIAREAMANASRHGGADEVRFTLEGEERAFHLDIVDNGLAGGAAGPFHPRSIADRVAALGGKLDARRGPAGARLYITVPRLSA